MGDTGPITLEEIKPVFDNLLMGPLALAVSGGADSMALLHLVARWAAEPWVVIGQYMGPVPIIVFTIDHRLRPESAAEAAWVGEVAASLGLPHKILVWHEPKPASGMQSAAREARYRLMHAAVAEEHRALGDDRLPQRAIVTAHHAGDQAETVLMRLARGSGLDGLSGMRERESLGMPDPQTGDVRAVRILRPLLHLPKARLMATLEAGGHTWREDPSNQAADFERVRVRRALVHLSDLGIGTEQIGRSAARLARARRAVMSSLAEVAPRMTALHDGVFAEIDPMLFNAAAEEYRIRILATLLQAYGGESPPARLAQVEALSAQLRGAGPAHCGLTLGGCRIERLGEGPIRIWREIGREGLAQVDLQPGGQANWDRRFHVALSADARAPVTVRALGSDGLRQIGAETAGFDARAGSQAPADALHTLPSFWRGAQLVAVPQFPSQRGNPEHYEARSLVTATFWRGAEPITRG